MSWSSTLGLISSVALFLPVLFILLFKLGGYKTFPALMIYYLIVFSYNIIQQRYISTEKDIIYYWGIGNNLLDAPLMLSFLTYFCSSVVLRKRMQLIIFSFIVFESIVLLWKGLNVNAVTIIIGPGLVLVMGFCLYFFVRQSKLTMMNGKGMGKAIISASLLFAYGCYALIYVIYYVFRSQYVEHTFLIYFLVTTFSSLLLCAGIIVERKRIYRLHEALTARKELAAIYKDTISTATFRRGPMLDFDKENWKN